MEKHTPDAAKVAERYRKLAAEFTRRVEGVPEGAWEAPTPCAEWSARDLLAHMIRNHTHMPAQVGIDMELWESVDTDPAAAWHEARAAMEKVLDDPQQSLKDYDGYFGRLTVAGTVDDFLCFDLLVHAWDLARATGQDETLPADELPRVWEMARGLGDTLRIEGVCGPEVTVEESAPEQERLMAFLGRRP